MRTLMTGPAWVSYAQIYVHGPDWGGELGECFGGQQNGLCGAAVPGQLFLITGLHTGKVGFSVELHGEAPPIDDRWEEIVEASFHPAGDTALVGWGGNGFWPLDLQLIDYRVRYCGWGMDAGHQGSPPMDDEPLIDRYLLQFWPAAPAADQVVKQTSASAAYWHDSARQQPVPPTPEERAEVKRLVVLERERASAALQLEEETRNWGGTLPSARLRDLSWTAIAVAQLDRALVDALDRAEAATQRAVARWSARRAFVEAQVAEVDWIVPALAAMDRGAALPEFFEDWAGVFDRLFSDERVVKTSVTTLDGRTDDFLQQAMAMPALYSAIDEDPLRAAVETVRVAVNTFGFGRDKEFFTELRRAFPAL